MLKHAYFSNYRNSIVKKDNSAQSSPHQQSAFSHCRKTRADNESEGKAQDRTTYFVEL